MADVSVKGEDGGDCFDDGDYEEVDEEEDEGTGDKKAGQPLVVSQEVLQDPDMLASLKQRLDSGTTNPSDHYHSLPGTVKRRVNALRNLQLRYVQLESRFYQEVHGLERKYASLYQPHLQRRRDIVSGTLEPSEVETEWTLNDEEHEATQGEEEEKEANKESHEEQRADVLGIPDFWLTILRNSDLLAYAVQEHDEPILKHLLDITVSLSEDEVPPSFTLEFHFSGNEFFSNATLRKTYELQATPGDTQPLAYDGPEIVACQGCEISWLEGRDVTQRVVRKRQKHKSTGSVRVVTRTERAESFFHFFTPPRVSDTECDKEDFLIQAMLATDFEVGHFIRDRLVPRAVLYFTGEALDDDDDDDDDDDYEDDDEEGEENEELDGKRCNENEDTKPQVG